jgi:hypothetical protein
LLETDGWADASPDARRALEDVLRRLTQAGIAIPTRYDHADIAAAETTIHGARGCEPASVSDLWGLHRRHSLRR